MLIKSCGAKRELITQDGTPTLYSEQFQEAYHSSRDGALSEALHKHIIPAFEYKKAKQELVILDICYGLGYNTLATLYYIQQQKITAKVKIISPEFDKELVESLADFDYPKEFALFANIIQKLSKDFVYKDEQIIVEILIGDAREELPKLDEKFDIVYQDAFSPKQNPLLWTREYFAVIASLIKNDAILTTYSVAASVRMALDENGFYLYKKPHTSLRDSMIASLNAMNGLEHIDMELKKQRNPNARSLRDEDFK